MSAVERWTEQDRELAVLERTAQRFANSKLVPERFQGKPDDIVVAGMGLIAAGVPVTPQSLAQCWVDDGTLNMQAQLQIGLAARHGLDCWFEQDDVSDEFAIINIQKPGRTRVGRYKYTIEMARTGHLLDEWVDHFEKDGNKWVWKGRLVISIDGERQVADEDMPEWAKRQIAQGRVKKKDAWFSFRQQMLMNRAATMGLHFEAPNALLGIPNLAAFDAPVPPEPPEGVDAETGEVLGSNDERPEADDDPSIEDAVLVGESDGPGGGVPPKGDSQSGGAERAAPADAPAEPATDEQKAELLERIRALGDGWTGTIKQAWHAKRLPSINPPAGASNAYPVFTVAHLDAVDEILTDVERQRKEIDDDRRKKVNAEMSKIGIKGDDRHAFIHAATDGATDSSAGLTGPQCKAIVEACERYAAEQEQPSSDDATATDEPPSLEFPDGEEPF